MTNWPADKIERRKVADLIPYARNARTHSDEQVALRNLVKGHITTSLKAWAHPATNILTFIRPHSLSICQKTSFKTSPEEMQSYLIVSAEQVRQ
jgi:hypothetical protein